MLVTAALPGTLRTSEIDKQSDLGREQAVRGELFTAIPGQPSGL